MAKNKLLGAIALSSLGAAALAHKSATGVVMERMMGMSAMRDVMKDLAAMMQGQVSDPARCAACHTGRNMLGGLKDTESLPGSGNLPGGSKAPPILVADLAAKDRTVANMAYALRTGVMPDGGTFGRRMAEVVHAGTSFLDEADREAIATSSLDQPGTPASMGTPVADAGMAGMAHTPRMQMNAD